MTSPAESVKPIQASNTAIRAGAVGGKGEGCRLLHSGPWQGGMPGSPMGPDSGCIA